ncbi:MAG TPA: PKD domain-containing protein [Bacteroidia bacterium]|nr:PKD domain-containing protein [Bacteroidia bacterium]
MIKRLQIAFICFFIFIPSLLFSTHIVGGAISYVHNGGSSYTVTLKLYRDCGPGTAGFPGSVTISVVGYNGAAFYPNKDITINLGTVTSVPSNLDKCATPPNPMPCTEQGIYTKTVTNLPPNPGGYHLYYQQTARNLSVTNAVNASCNCIGESFYADIPGTSMYWTEDFLLPNGTTIDNGTTAWTTAPGATAPTTASVQGNLFEITGKNNAVQTWTSQVINIAGYTGGVDLSAGLSESGDLENGDSIKTYYKLNGGAWTLFATNGSLANDFNAGSTAIQTNLTGSTVQIMVRVTFDGSSANDEIYRFDNINVYGRSFLANSDPAYDLIPPLFLCAGKPFSYDHSATDIDGDSLVYSFYTPYDGDNNAGALDPTFINNVATFTPIKWVAGYSATNPLGGTPLTLNSSTGLLQGTPNTLGQFVVGIMVKEYRNGKYMSQTIRDFQFNVVSCPEQISAVLKPITVCNTRTVNFQNYGGSTGNNWHWDFGNTAVTTDVSTLNFPSYTYPAAGTYTVRLITGYQTNCADTATAKVDVVTIKAGFTHNAPKCVNTPVAFTQASTITSNDVIITYLWDFGDGTTASSANATHAYANGGTYKVLLTLTSNLGCGDTISKYIKIDPKPIPNAGPDQTVCATVGSVVLNGSVTNATGGTWTTTGTGTFQANPNILNPTYKPSAADTVAGTVKLILTTTGNATCASVSDTMVVSFSNNSTKANAGPDKTICGITSTTISGNAPSIGTGKWTVVSGAATITNPNSATTTVTGLTTPGASYTFRWTITNTACIPSTDDVVITVDLQPTTANAGPNQTICNTTTATLAANTPVVGTGLWTVVSGTATITTPTSPTSTVTGLVPGDSVVLKWTITKGLCNSSATVKIILVKAPVVNAGPDQAFCTPTNTVLNGSVVGNTTTGIWTTLGNGTFSPNATTLTATYIPGSLDITNKKVTLVLTSTNNGVCNVASDSMNIAFTGFEGTITVAATNVSCYGNTDGTATASVVNGFPPYTYFWSTVPAQTGATATNLGIGTYTVTLKNAKGCTAPATATITQPAPLAVNGTATDIACYGGNNGMINITPTGGTAPYNYLCMPGNQTAVPFTNLGLGTYTVTITDAKNCSLTQTYTINQSTEILTSFSIAPVSCFGKNDGIINSTTTGGVPPYTYSWNPTGVTSANISNLAAGNYTLTVTDKLGCSMSSSTLINEPTTLTATVTVTNETCSELNNGTASVAVSGGTPNYTYTWAPGGTKTPNVSNLPAGSYTVTIKDLKGCTITPIATITQPSFLNVNLISVVNVSCNGGSNGSVTANPTGGTIPYTYLWMPGNITTAKLSNVPIGTYTVTVIDKNGCTNSNSVTLTEPTPITVTSTITNVSCAGGNNGTIKIVASGGKPSYTYLWQPVNKTTANLNGLTAGSYTLTVTDANGCKNTSVHVVGQPLPIAISISSVNVSCFGGTDATATANVTGGTTPYTYSWSSGGVTNATITGLKIGNYTVTVTDSANCKASKSVTITQPLKLTAIASAQDETCDYLNDGSVTVAPAGGTSPYSYEWQPTNDTTATVNNLPTGTYTVIVTDAKGCTVGTSAVVNEPLPLSIVFDPKSNVSCFGGTDGAVIVVASGGTPNYTYNWMPGNFNVDGIFNILSGTYTVTVKDKNNCQIQDTVTIDQPSSPLSVSATSQITTCFGGGDGSATAVGAGGTAPYTYEWLPGNKTGATINNLTAGTYTVTATDSKGCTSASTIVVNEPPEITITSKSYEAACFLATGKAKVTASGGTPPYSYLWSPIGGTSDSVSDLYSGKYWVTVSDSHGCKSSESVNIDDAGVPKPTIFSVVNVKCYGDSTGSAKVAVTGGSGNYTYLWLPHGGTGTTAVNLTAGSYTVIVKDSLGCQSLATTSPDITQPPLIEPNITTTLVSCFGGNNGTANVTASGGVPGYTFTWLPGGSTGTTIQNLAAGTYTLQAMDANGCIVKKKYNVDQPTALYLTLSKKAVSCFGGSDGSVNSLALGGTAPYMYKWSPVNVNGQKLANVPAGTYTVTTTDFKGCTLSSSITIDQPTPVVVTPSSTNATCNLPNGNASVTVSGGTSPYAYQWVAHTSTTNEADSLNEGSYTVWVKDKNSCSSSTTIVVNREMAPSISITSITDVSCYGGSDGSATAVLSGGKGPFNYLWLPSGGTNLTASNLIAGSYTISVTDANGCKAADTTDPAIKEPLELALTTTSESIKCFGKKDGSVTVLAGGGTAPYNYKWLPGLQTTPAITNVSPGTYTVEVIDGKNCKQSISATIVQPDTLISSITSFANVNCFGETNGSATVGVTGGTLNYDYTWAPSGGNGPTIIDLAAGTYTVTIVDANSCTTSSVATITQPATKVNATAVSTNINCFGGSNGSANISVTGGTKDYTFKWTPTGGTDSTATQLKANNYFVQIKDAKGCETNISVPITQPALLKGSLIITEPTCGFANGSIISEVSGGTPPYNYLWSPDSSKISSVLGLRGGTFSLDVVDQKRCALKLDATLVDIPSPVLAIAAIKDVSCFGKNDGNISLNIDKGTKPFKINWSPYGGDQTVAENLVAGIYTATVIDSLGCEASVLGVVKEPSPLDLKLLSSSNVKCYNDPNGAATVEATGGTAGYLYSWLPINTNLPSNTNLSAGTYTVNVTDQKSCAASVSILIDQPLPLVASIINVKNNKCFNDTLGSISIKTNGGTIPYAYEWNTSPLQFGDEAKNLKAGKYQVTITDINGCKTQKDTTLTQPTQVVTTTVLNDTLCPGEEATLKATAKGGVGNYYFLWSPTDSVNFGTFKTTPTATTTYTVTAYDLNGCAGTPDSAKALMYSLTADNIDVLANSPLCPGQSTPLSLKTNGITGKLSYLWNNNLGTSAGPFKITLYQPNTYVVQVTNQCGTSVSDSIRILITPQPVLIMKKDTNEICMPGSIHFQDSSVVGNSQDPITSWTWNFGDGTTSSLQNPVHYYKSAGQFPVTLVVKTGGGCTSNSLGTPILVTVHPKPNADFSVNKTVLDLPYDELKCFNQSTGAVSYKWDFADETTSTEENPTHKYTLLDEYNIRLIATSKFGCLDTAFKSVRTDADIIFPSAFTPNPLGSTNGSYDVKSLSNDVFFPYTSGVISFKLQVFDRWGELIFESFNVDKGWDGYYNGKLCEQGVYIWKADVKLSNGKTFNKTGDVTLLR